MIIKLSPVRADAELAVLKLGDALTINGIQFDFSQVSEGDTLPAVALSSDWLADAVERIDGNLVLTIRMPHGADADESIRFPADIVNPPDGAVRLPTGTAAGPESSTPGTIDWSQLITKAMKDAAAAAIQLADAKAELTARNNKAIVQIARIQDRIDTIGFGIDIGEATPEEEAEQAALLITLKTWKTYKYALGKVTVQPTWYQAPVWPVEPPIPEIIAAPMMRAAEAI